MTREGLGQCALLGDVRDSRQLQALLLLVGGDGLEILHKALPTWTGWRRGIWHTGFRHDCRPSKKQTCFKWSEDLVQTWYHAIHFSWLLILALSLTLKLFVFIMYFDTVIKILTGWQSSRAWLYVQATAKRMCLSWFYASGYCPFPLPAPSRLF